MKQYQHILSRLAALKLKGIASSLDSEIDEAESRKVSYLGFLGSLLDAEINYRTERRMKRNLAAAHFPVVKHLEEFEFGRVKGITKSDMSVLLDFRWLDNHSNLLFFGPPGLGKTHLSIALGMKAIAAGYTVCFERVTNLIRLLKIAEIQRTARFRVNRIMKADLVIIESDIPPSNEKRRTCSSTW